MWVGVNILHPSIESTSGTYLRLITCTSLINTFYVFRTRVFIHFITGCVWCRGSVVSWIVMISACMSWISSLSSLSLFLIPFMLTCSMMRFLSLVLLGMCDCGVSIAMWSSLLCMWGYRGTLCGCSGCCVCDAYTNVCGACVYAERVIWCEVDGNAVVGGWMRCVCGECRACGWYTWFRYCVYRSWRVMDECGAWDERSWWSMGDVYVFGLGRRGWGGDWVDERIWLGLYQSCGNRGSVGRVFVFWLRWCG